jgi:hypothetical protein
LLSSTIEKYWASVVGGRFSNIPPAAIPARRFKQ